MSNLPENYPDDIVGQEFGEWKVLKALPIGEEHKSQMYWCECSCGVEQEIRRHNLTNGQTTRCQNCHMQNMHSIQKERRGRFRVSTYLGLSWRRLVKHHDDWANLSWVEDYQKFAAALQEAWGDNFDETCRVQLKNIDEPVSIENLERTDRFRVGREFYLIGDRHWSKPEIADVLERSQERIRQMINKGQLPEIEKRMREAGAIGDEDDAEQS